MKAVDELITLVALLDEDLEIARRVPNTNGVLHRLRAQHLRDIAAAAHEAQLVLDRHDGEDWTWRWRNYSPGEHSWTS